MSARRSHGPFFPRPRDGNEIGIASAYAAIAAPPVPSRVARRDGLWTLVREQRLPDGSLLTITTDITERKEIEG